MTIVSAYDVSFARFQSVAVEFRLAGASSRLQ